MNSSSVNRNPGWYNMIKCITLFHNKSKMHFHTKSSKHQRQRTKFNLKMAATDCHVQFQERSKFTTKGHSSHCTHNRIKTHANSRFLKSAWYEFTYHHHHHLYLCEKIFDLYHNHDHDQYCLQCTICCTHFLLMKLYHRLDEC